MAVPPEITNFQSMPRSNITDRPRHHGAESRFRGDCYGTKEASLRNLPPARTRREKTAILVSPTLALAHRMVSGVEVVSALAGRGGETGDQGVSLKTVPQPEPVDQQPEPVPTPPYAVVP